MASKQSTKVTLQVAIKFARDLQHHKRGDNSRFERMVNGRGKGVVSRDDAVTSIQRIVQRVDVANHWPATCAALMRWLTDAEASGAGKHLSF